MYRHRFYGDRHRRFIECVHQGLVDIALLHRERAEAVLVAVPCRLGVKKDNSHAVSWQ